MSNISILRSREGEPVARHSVGKLPINLFGAVMGLTGLSLAWREAVKVVSLPEAIGEAIGWIALLTFVSLAVAYAAKWLKHPELVGAEFAHPVQGNFFGTFAISLLLLSVFLGRYSATVGQAVWVAGLLMTFALAYVVAIRFLGRQHDSDHTLPPLLIPGVATLDIAVTGHAMPFSWAHEVNMFAFAVGSIVATVFVTLIFARLRHNEPVPLHARPSLMVLVAPFAVGFLAYTNLTGSVDMLASVLFYFALFLVLVLSPMVFRRAVSFSVAWWAISFPLAAFTIAFFRYAHAVDSEVLKHLALAMFIFLAAAIAIVFLRTLNEVLTGRLFREH